MAFTTNLHATFYVFSDDLFREPKRNSNIERLGLSCITLNLLGLAQLLDAAQVLRKTLFLVVQRHMI